MITWLRRRLAGGDAGFTLIEVLLAATLGTIVAAGALTLLDVTLRRTSEINQRIDSDSAGRQLMDRVTRDLHSQICQTTDVPPIRQTTKGVVGGHYQESVSFYADMTDGRANAVPDLRTLTFDETDRTIVEDIAKGTKSGTTVSYAAPYIHRIVGTNVIRDVDKDNNPLPVFTYFAFNTPPAGTEPTPDRELASPMVAGSPNPGPIGQIARIGVRFRELPTGKAVKTRTSTAFVDDVYVRAADPNDPAPIPTCV